VGGDGGEGEAGEMGVKWQAGSVAALEGWREEGIIGGTICDILLVGMSSRASIGAWGGGGG